VLTSVHAFAVDPKRGIFILALFALFIGGALALYAWRTARIGLGGAFSAISRESFLLVNNVLLTAAAGTVFLGTLYPLALDAIGGGKISVGPPYFEAVFVPLMAPALFLMGIGPLARWKQTSLPELAVLLRWALAVSFLTGLLLPLVLGKWSPMVGFGLFLAIFIVLSSLVSFRKSWRQTRAHYGMVIAHIGVAVFVVGITVVKGYESEKDATLKDGETVELGAYSFRLERVASVTGPNYRAAQAAIAVSKNGQPVRTLYPERRVYSVQQQVMTEAAIDTGLTRDIYVSLGDPVDGNAWVVRVQHKPFVDWIWGGCLIMALGGFLAASDRRYRFAVQPRNSLLVEAKA
jgi:cytochrome c-type biogenesis protein CcmF